MILLHDALPETATRAKWHYTWLQTTSPDALHDGTLTVTEETGVRTVRTVSDVYRVQETPLLGRPGRAFLLLKDKHAGDLDTVAGRKNAERVGDVYELHLFADGNFRCTCTAGNVGRYACLHALAMTEVVEADGLPEPPTARRQRMPKSQPTAYGRQCHLYQEDGGI